MKGCGNKRRAKKKELPANRQFLAEERCDGPEMPRVVFRCTAARKFCFHRPRPVGGDWLPLPPSVAPKVAIYRRRFGDAENGKPSLCVCIEPPINK